MSTSQPNILPDTGHPVSRLGVTLINMSWEFPQDAWDLFQRGITMLHQESRIYAITLTATLSNKVGMSWNEKRSNNIIYQHVMLIQHYSYSYIQY